MLPSTRRSAKVLAAAAVIPAGLLLASAASPAAAATSAHVATARQDRVLAQHHAAPRYHIRQILFGSKLRHTFRAAGSANGAPSR
jgi:pyruvate dehydrogenase complex dehydrogenase (E1) component